MPPKQPQRSSYKPQPINTYDTGLGTKRPKKRNKIGQIVFLLLGVVFVVSGVGFFVWYQTALRPVSSDSNVAEVRFEIAKNATPTQIGQQLQKDKIIRSAPAFVIHARITGARANFKAGMFAVSPASSTPEVIQQLTQEKAREMSITFLPGATIFDNKELLLKHGYSEDEVDQAFAKTYNHPLLADKPSGSGLEGYIYGETYAFAADATVEQIFNRTFDEMYAQLKTNGLLVKYKAKGLDLHEAIILASIIQKEVSGQDDQRQVAQVFFKRLKEGMELGADATFVYGARILGVQPSVNLDSPYNTRISKGLPPGPISNPGIDALTAVANPAQGDYVYFVSGDDGRNYFSHTLEEHEENTRRYCHRNCQLF